MISVIIPTYNRVKLLPRALESVLAQSYQDIELLVIDDGSTDETEQLIKNNYPQVKYLYQQNRGVSAARNLGISRAQGEWLAFLDSDDQWLPEKLEKQYAALEKSNLQICHSNEIWQRNGKLVKQQAKHYKSGGNQFARCLESCVIGPSAIVVHRDVFKELGIFDEALPDCEDYDMWLRICAKYQLAFCSEALLIKHAGNWPQLSLKSGPLDKYRIYALNKLLNFTNLTEEQRLLTQQMLQAKLDIYLAGCKKYNKQLEAEFFKNL